MAVNESTLQKCLGYSLIGLAAYLLVIVENIGAGIAASAGILLLFLARLARFKRIKGWGFEAEMWEDTQIEAERLIASLKSVAVLTSREAILQSIKSGRFGGGKRWEYHWKLYEEMISAQEGIVDPESKHKIKSSVDRWFLHDIVIKEYGILLTLAEQGIESARTKIRDKHGSQPSNPMEYSKEMGRVSEAINRGGGLFELADSKPFVDSIDLWWLGISAILAEYDVKISMPSDVRSRLDTYKALEALPEMPVTKELIARADH